MSDMRTDQRGDERMGRLEERLVREREAGMSPPSAAMVDRLMRVVDAEARAAGERARVGREVGGRARGAARRRLVVRAAIGAVCGVAAGYVLVSVIVGGFGRERTQPAAEGTRVVGAGAGAGREASASAVLSASLGVLPRSDGALARATTEPLRRGVDGLKPAVWWGAWMPSRGGGEDEAGRPSGE